jgi:hypothetical protein
MNRQNRESKNPRTIICSITKQEYNQNTKEKTGTANKAKRHRGESRTLKKGK